MDELDEFESLDKVDDSGDIKNKILFSVLVVSTIIFICIYSCDSFRKVVIIYLKWVKRPMRTPGESAWGNFFREWATFCEDERLVGQMISVPQLRVTNASRSANRHLRLFGDHVTYTTAVVDAESRGEYVSLRCKRFCAVSKFVPFFAWPKPKIPLLVVPRSFFAAKPLESAWYAGHSRPNFNFKQAESKQ